MEYRPSETILSSLRSRVWLAVCVLAVINCVSGLGSYLAATYLFFNPMAPVAIGFAISTLVTIAYGRWLSDEVMRPVEKAVLAVKSLERNPTASLPASTGSTETDEILTSIQRSSRQINNLLTLMDNVSSGNTSVANEPLLESDRLSAAFQKLIQKVTDSIDSKEQLENLQRSLRTITDDMVAVKAGSVELEIKSSSPLTEEIAHSFNTLFSRSKAIGRSLRLDLNESSHAVPHALEKLKLGMEATVSSGASINKTILMLKESPARSKQFAEEMASATKALEDFELSFGTGRSGTVEMSETVGSLKKYTIALQRKWKELSDAAQNLHNVVRLADDIARRANLIAINSSIGPLDLIGESATRPDDVSAIAERALRLQKELIGLDKSLNQNISEADGSIAEILSTCSTLSDVTGTALQSLIKMQPLVAGFSDLPGRFAQLGADTDKDKEHLLRLLSTVFFELESGAFLLRESEQTIRNIESSIRSSIITADELGTLRQPELPAAMPLDTADFYTSSGLQNVQDALEISGEN